MSSDYSNLFRGGGITSSGSGNGKSKGPKVLAYFVLLCCIALTIVWFSGYFDENDNVDASNPGNADSSPAHSSQATSAPVIAPHQSLKSSNPQEKTKSISKQEGSSEKVAELSKKLEMANDLFKKEDYVNAADTASSILAETDENTTIGAQAAKILGDANVKIFMSDIPSPRKKLYTIKSGDNLISIANRFGTTVEAIQKSNGLDPSNPVIYPGKTLYIYSGDWEVKVSKGKYKLYLYDKGKLFKVYSVGVGRQGRTPLGTFIIQNKQKEPVWYYNGHTIPYGNKKNVLGTRWMALKPTGKTDKNLRGYGIHGTWKPETIGTQCSNGCVRMKNDDVNELFTILPYHTKVTIEE